MLGLLLACHPPDPPRPAGRDDDSAPVPTPAPTGDTAEDRLPPRCAPAWSVVPALPVEGAAVTATWACTTGEDERGFAAVIDEAPPGAAVDGRAVTWTPGRADAGEWRVSVVVQPTAPGPRPVEDAHLDVWVSDAGPGVPDNPLPDPIAYPQELGLPVLWCDPDGALTESYVAGTCWSDGEVYAVSLKIRGAASASYPKPSLTVDFGARPLDGAPYGLHDKTHLVLITTFDDNSYVRQKRVYDTWRSLGALRGDDRPPIDTAYVVLYLSGAYFGLYVAADHVDDEFFGERGFDRSGSVYKAVSHDANFRRTTASGAPKTDLGLGYEKKEGDPADWTDLTDVVAFVADSDAATFAAGADGRFAVPEFRDWFLLVSYFAAADSAGKNAYLYADPAARRLRYVPWDFNHALGQDWTTARVPVDWYSDFRSTNAIFERLQTDPALAAGLWDAWASASAPGAPFDPAVLRASLDADLALTEASARRDWAVWEGAYRAYPRWSGRRDLTSYDEEVAYLRAWVDGRPAAYAAHVP